MIAKGRFDVSIFKPSKHRDEDFEAAIKRGELDHLLLDLEVEQRARSNNMLFDNLMPSLFYRAGWNGCPAAPDPYDDWSGSGSGIWCVYLATTDDDPTYQESWDLNYWAYGYNMPNCANCGSSTHGARRFYNDQAAPYEVWVAADGRQQIFFRNRWFFLPTQGYSDNIRSIVLAWYREASRSLTDQNAVNKRSIGRVRLRDQDGEKVRLNKTAYQAMLLEYTFSFVSV